MTQPPEPPPESTPPPHESTPPPPGSTTPPTGSTPPPGPPPGEPAYGQPSAGQPPAGQPGWQGQGAGFPEHQAAGQGQLSPADERTWGMLAHLSALLAAFVALAFLGPLLVMLIQGPKSDFVRRQSVEALNFQITTYIAAI